jgi:hypothetical protein
MHKVKFNHVLMTCLLLCVVEHIIIKNISNVFLSYWASQNSILCALEQDKKKFAPEKFIDFHMSSESLGLITTSAVENN